MTRANRPRIARVESAEAKAKVEQAWIDYKTTGSEEARQVLLVHYWPTVQITARHMASKMPEHVDVDDLTSFGVLGLIDAIEKFDLSRGLVFTSYADRRIRGSIIDGLRTDGWGNRRIFTQIRQRNEAIDELTSVHLRPPTVPELAAHLGLTEEEFRQTTIEQVGSSLLSLDATNPGEDSGALALSANLPDVTLGDGLHNIEAEERARALAIKVITLTEVQKVVLALSYIEGLTNTEIAELLCVSGSRVSQIRRQSFQAMMADQAVAA